MVKDQYLDKFKIIKGVTGELAKKEDLGALFTIYIERSPPQLLDSFMLSVSWVVVQLQRPPTRAKS